METRIRFGSRRFIALVAVLSVLLVLVAVGLWFFVPRAIHTSSVPIKPHPDDIQDAEIFFRDYWRRPIPLQGTPPVSFSEREASLGPEACGSCHEKQHADWKESLHSKAMGPGPWGQIIDLARNSPEDGILCMTCHAPLSEQMAVVAKASTGGEQTYVENPSFDSRLQLQGITCAACHVRQHQRFGPPKAEGPAATSYPPGLPNHGGVRRTLNFEKAEFCKGCHQFDPENTVLVNGKPLQDTYREWKNSIWGQGGAACQDCHMPGRRHLWKGIHDAEWVRGGVRVEAHMQRPDSKHDDALALEIEVVNAAVGHKFPTYITPKIFVRAALLDRAGKVLSGTEQEKIIGWDARFEGGQWKESFDTRISPGEKFQHSFRWTTNRRAIKAKAWVEVQPDHFYHVHFYPAYLKGDDLSPEGRKLIKKALEESGRSSYVLFEKSFSVR